MSAFRNAAPPAGHERGKKAIGIRLHVSFPKRSTVAALAASLLLAATGTSTASATYLTDTASHPPPTSGGFAYYDTYGAFGPDHAGFPGRGQSFVDPIFGSTITRLTSEVGAHSWSDIYSKNGNFNADNTLMAHNTPGGRQFINPATGAVVRASVPGNDNSSFDPVDPDVWWWYAFGGTTLNRYSVSAGTSTVVKTFAQPIGNNGGSIDWIDRTGRYMVLHLGNTWRMYDVKADVLYANPIPDTYGNDPGYTGLTPDGNYIITTNNGNPNAHRSWAVDHASRSVSATGVVFWTLCGDHGDFVSASDGKSYWVVFECDSVAAVYAVDVSLPQSHANRAKQLADNRQLMKTSWSDSGHFSRVSRGSMQDWAFGSIESGDDTFGSSVASWRAYKQEIVMMNVLTGEVRRLAHHRSRSPFADYYYQPRVSASWDGSVVAWASNFGVSGNGYADIYAIHLDAGGPPAPAPLTLAFSNPASGATVSGTVTVTLAASGGSGSGYGYTVKAGSTTIYAGTNASFSWNTTSAAGALTLSGTVTDSADNSAFATRDVTVSNPPSFATPGEFVDLGNGTFSEVATGRVVTLAEMQAKFPGPRYSHATADGWRDNYLGWLWTKAELAGRGVTFTTSGAAVEPAVAPSAAPSGPSAPAAAVFATPGQFVDLNDGTFREAANGNMWLLREMRAKFPGARYSQVDPGAWRDNYTGWRWTKGELAARGVSVDASGAGAEPSAPPSAAASGPSAPAADVFATPGEFVDLGDGTFREAADGNLWLLREMQAKFPGVRYSQVDPGAWRDNYTGWLWTKSELAARGVSVGP